MDKKTLYCNDLKSTQTDLYTECYPNPNPSRLVCMFVGGGGSIDKLILKCIRQQKGSITFKTVSRKENEIGTHRTGFKTQYQAKHKCTFEHGVQRRADI